MPSLQHLSLYQNDFNDLPAPFIHALIRHPEFESFNLSGNLGLGCSNHQSTPFSINRLLSELHYSASLFPLNLQDLDLQGLELTAECYEPALEKLLSVGSRGVHHLELCANPFLSSLSSLSKTLARIILHQNLHIQQFSIDGMGEEEEEEEEGSEG